MSIQQQVLLRHRSEGHLRFAMPADAFRPGIVERLGAGLRALEGIYRVDLYARQGKLAIRYLETVCGFPEVIRRLYAVLGELAADMARPAATPPAAINKRGNGKVQNFSSTAPGRWLREKLDEARETATAMGIVIVRGFRALESKPRWMKEFLNDLLMLFLIKLHWHHIITLWIPNPWRYRYEWMATFYLIYLQMQSRLPQPAH